GPDQHPPPSFRRMPESILSAHDGGKPPQRPSPEEPSPLWGEGGRRPVRGRPSAVRSPLTPALSPEGRGGRKEARGLPPRRNRSVPCPFLLQTQTRRPTMASPNDTEKSPEELEKRVWDLAEKLRFCMFTSWDGDRQHQRPLTAMPDHDEGVIHFLVDEEGSKNWEVEKYPTVALAFMDSGKNDYLTIAGHADLS